MQSQEPMCYITYAVPARLMPQLKIAEDAAPVIDAVPLQDETQLYPPGFMPEWFLRGSFPEDDFED